MERATTPQPRCNVRSTCAGARRLQTLHTFVDTTRVPARTSLGYRPALDGLRALAVLGVLAYHSQQRLAPGFLGVDVFFVLSGFLITTILLQEWHATQTVRFTRFYARRALRLFPALAVVVAVVAIYSLACAPAVAIGDNQRGANLRGVLATIFYASNWVRAMWSSPYDVLGLLGHTWSLAIEEQFYVLWPAILWLVLSSRRGPVFVASLTLAGIVLFAGWRDVQTLTGVPWWRIYNGLDSRADELLVGALLAQAFVAGWLPRSAWFPHAAQAGFLAICAMIVVLITRIPTNEVVFVAVMPLFTVAVALLIGSLLSPQPSALRTVLASAPLLRICRISYGVYLWHFPIFGVLTPGVVGGDANVAFAAQLVTTLSVAALSYRFIEAPFLAFKDCGSRAWPFWRTRPHPVTTLGADVPAPAPALP
ncbi:MAG: hypothetical protein NVSMB2_23330 [Chloroflexota bacterium]